MGSFFGGGFFAGGFFSGAVVVLTQVFVEIRTFATTATQRRRMY